MIDLHNHVLPGLDDGAVDVDEALAMCRAAADAGIDIVAGTPHVSELYPTSADRMEAALDELRRAAEGIVRVVGGGEVDPGQLDRPQEELRRFALAGNPRYLLVETPFHGWPLDLADRLFRLRAGGVTPVLAHPERNPDVQQRPELLEPIVAGGALVQLTAGSVDGRFGPRAQTSARALLDRGLAHLLASDAHGPHHRTIGMRRAVAALGDEELGHWLTESVPRAIVDGGEVPERPEPAAPRRRFRPFG